MKKEFNSLRVSFTECRTEFALSKCKSDEKIAELQRQVTALKESNLDLVRRVNELSPQKVVAPWETCSKSENPSEPWEPKSEEKTNDTIEAAEKPKSTEKPKAKNWNAICDAELIDDEEEEEQRPVPKEASKSSAPKNILEQIQQSRPNVSQKNWNLIEEFMNLFRAYLDSLRLWSVQHVKERLDKIGLYNMIVIVTSIREWKFDSPQFVPLAQAVLLELPKMLEENELICRGCGFRMFTRGNVLDHLHDPNHLNGIQRFDEIYLVPSKAVNDVLSNLCKLLNRSWIIKRGEVELEDKGKELFRNIKDASRLRPTEEFVIRKSQESLALACIGDEKALALANNGRPLSLEEDEYMIRTLRKWAKKNGQQYLTEYEEHLSTGVAHCAACQVAYVSRAEYYKHVTSYLHGITDQSIFSAMIVRMARGEQDWDFTM